MPWIISDTDIDSITTAKNLANSLELITPVIYDEEINIKDEPSFFGDTCYHLSAQGREKRSVELAEQLKDLL
ncbi:MAG: hypothetical protein DSM107014_01640 [Gomphosphaeria aponina SAG 52.96 = DSM 107014]|uniref:Uncharacterized protein n=1 Tax=Gomphosphaeria aponina SAG 52.96 = DSM 107014 TaxID=1521640 RepID=A0A941JNS1_9CHRO|nr:hypothetical protein [Gomphosphaeria aponina SAG 52.96 = DSM 107014]